MGKIVIVCAAIGSIAIANAQGSAGSYGQGRGGGFSGGFGGGGLGGRLGDMEEDRKAVRPDADDNTRMWQTRTAILTPGDRVEFKFKLKDNEAIFAGVTSDAFDPALTMEDDKGVVLVKNDDREEGDQSPFLIFRAPKEGDYVLKVVSYRSAAGGKFRIKIRKIRYQQIELGARRYEQIPSIPETPEFGGESNHVMLCLVGRKKGLVLDLRQVFANRLGQRSIISTAGMIGPTGVPGNDFDAVAPAVSPIVPTIVKLKQDGDIFLEYVTDVREGIETDFQEVTVIPGSRTMDEKLELAPGEAKVVELRCRRETWFALRSTPPRPTRF